VQQHERHAKRPPPIEVDIQGAGVVIVALRGEHDLSTQPEVAQALTRASDYPEVLVDLSDCTFMDSSVIAALVGTSRKLESRDRRLELVIPADAHTVQRIACLTNIAELIPVHDTREDGIAAIARRLGDG
jgi:anti-anti-sigma factor